ncbi:MAG: cyclic nucleotide-binding domain-containing protein [Chloroflexi bacterium]|nr:cyclic nucleotide-binding domain-containing protein [Chloroflexota bacterium]
MFNDPANIEAIKIIPLFLDFNNNQLSRISEIADVIELDPGDIPIQEGAQLDYLYILMDGEIKVEVFVPTRGQLETARLGPLDILGWSSMTPVVRQRTGTTTAITHCRLIRIHSKQLAKLCEEDHDIGFYIYRRIANVAARSFLTTRLQFMNIIVEDRQSISENNFSA